MTMNKSRVPGTVAGFYSFLQSDKLIKRKSQYILEIFAFIFIVWRETGFDYLLKLVLKPMSTNRSTV